MIIVVSNPYLALPQVPETEVDVRAMFKDAGVYEGKGCSTVEMRLKDDKAATFPSIWYI